MATDSSDWLASGYGTPGPAIVFTAPGGTTVTHEIQVTAGGSTFKFTSVDLYSSTMPIPDQINGPPNSVVVFSLSATVPHDLGRHGTSCTSDGTGYSRYACHQAE